MQVGQLVGVKLDRNIMCLGRIENAGDFIRQEGNAFAKPSTASASPCSAMAGSMSLITRSI